MAKKRKIRNWAEIEESGGLATVPEVAQVLMVSNPTVYSLIKKGVLPAVKLGELATRIRPQDVNDLVAQGGYLKKQETRKRQETTLKGDYLPAPRGKPQQ